MFICVIPEENILGTSFLKKNFTFLVILKLIFIIGLKYFLTKIKRIISWNNPAIETP